MENQSGKSPRLDELLTLDEFQAGHAKLFPSRASLDWHIRQHRREYIGGSALFEVAGRLLVHAPTFLRIALEIGSSKMAQRHGIEGSK